MARRTSLELDLESYGSSCLGAPLQWLPAREKCRLLIIAGIHGEEPETTVSLSRALRSLHPAEISPDIGIVLCANPDGVSLGTRGNARGVDLNRNFPSTCWQNKPASCRWHADETEEIPIGTGDSPASEPESQALLQLLESSEPEITLTLHAPLACIDDPDETILGRQLAEATRLPLVRDIGYPTPGSMGSWAREKSLPWITWEFPQEGIETLSRTQVPTLLSVITGKLAG